MIDNKNSMGPKHTLLFSVLTLVVVGAGLVYTINKNNALDRYSADAARRTTNLSNKVSSNKCYSGQAEVGVILNDRKDVNGVSFELKTLNPSIVYDSYDSSVSGWSTNVNQISSTNVRYVSASPTVGSGGEVNLVTLKYAINGISSYPSKDMFTLIPEQTYISNSNGEKIEGRSLSASIIFHGAQSEALDQVPCVNTRNSKKNLSGESEAGGIGAQSAGVSIYSCTDTSVRGDIAPSASPDGVVDVGDVTAVMRIAVGLEEPPSNLCCVDVAPPGPTPFDDGDGDVNVGDVVRVLRAAVMLENLGTCNNPGGIEAGSLDLGRSGAMPNNNIVYAGGPQVKNAVFRATAIDEPFSITNLRVKVPLEAANSVRELTLKYNDSAGVTRTRSAVLSIGTEAYAQFSALDIYVPADDFADFDVWISVPDFFSGAETGDVISTIIDHDSGFSAEGSNSGTVLNTFGSADIASNSVAGRGESTVRGSTITFVPLANSGSPATVRPIYKFTASASPEGDVDIKKITFDVTADGVTLSNFRLRNATLGTDLNIDPVPVIDPSGRVTIWIGSEGNNVTERIATANTYNYELYAVVQGWSSGDTLGVGISEDSVQFGPDSVADLSTSNLIWSDVSAIPHSVGSNDWYSGYLIEEIPGYTFW